MPKVVPQYKEEARKRIVEAALRVFAEKGYHEATMEEVADKLGVSEGAIYLYFKSKRELFKATGQSDRQRGEQIIRSLYRNADPVGSYVDSLTSLHEEYVLMSGLIFDLFAEASRDVSFRKIIREGFDGSRKILQEFLRELGKRGMIGTDADVHFISMGLLALSYGYIISRVLGVEKEEAKRAWAEAIRAMLNGTLTKAGKRI